MTRVEDAALCRVFFTQTGRTRKEIGGYSLINVNECIDDKSLFDAWRNIARRTPSSARLWVHECSQDFAKDRWGCHFADSALSSMRVRSSSEIMPCLRSFTLGPLKRTIAGPSQDPYL
jgi:hypothetical protein